MLILNLKKKLKKITGILKNEGLYGIYWRIMVRIAGDPYHKEYQKSYLKWYENNGIHTINIEKQIDEVKKFASKPLISLITPTYNTNPNYLKKCIESVILQTYKNWELILIDDNSPNQEVRDIIENYSKKDSRIKFVFRKNNGHISIASNDGLNNSKGEWIGLLDHDDILWPNALFEVVKRINEKPKTQFIYSDEDKIAEDGKTHCDPFFKPDWSPHFLWSCNYITHFAVINKNLIEKVDGFRKETDGAQDWDLFLRVIDAINGFLDHPWNPDCKIQHIDTILYSWRKSETSTASNRHALSAKNYAYLAQENVLKDEVLRNGGGIVKNSKYIGIYEIYPNYKEKSVAIIIPTKNNFDYISRLVNSLNQSTYHNFKIKIVDNGSNSETLRKYKEFGQKIDLLHFDKSFNFSKICNYAAEKSSEDFYLFLNDDTEILTKDWLEKMMAYASRKEVGAVGARLLYPNGYIQHNGLIFGFEKGVVLGNKGFVSNYFVNKDPNFNYGIPSLLLENTRPYTAVTAACLLINSKKHKEIGGFDENFKIAFNDIDYCLKLNKLGYFNICLKQSVLIHHESTSLGRPNEVKRDIKIFSNEIKMLRDKWGSIVDRDSFMNKNYELLEGKLHVRRI